LPWKTFRFPIPVLVDRPDVPELLAHMRDDTISNDDRHTYLSELAEAAQDVFGEDAERFYGHDHGEA
jgi:hypothetical protein